MVRTRGNLELRRMNLDGGDQQILATTTRRIVTGADVSNDGKWVLYEDDPDGYPTLWRVPVAGGNPEQLTRYPSERVAISPDSSRIAFYYRASMEDPRYWRVGVAPITGGEPELSFDQPSYFARSIVVWSTDGAALLVNTMPDDRSNLWRLPLDGGAPERLTDLHEPRLSWVDFSPDGETMVYNITTWERNALLIQNFR